MGLEVNRVCVYEVESDDIRPAFQSFVFGRRFKLVPLWCGGVLTLGRCVDGSVFLNLDRGIHLGGDNFSVLMLSSNISCVLSLII